MRRLVRLNIITAIALVITLQACALFKSDPVGATLLTMKNSYEAAVRTAGQAYLNGAITEVQLRGFRDGANRFYQSYLAIVAAHEAGSLKEGDERLKLVQEALSALETIIAKQVLQKG